MDLGPGTMIGGRYRLERLIGRGGMGEVWSAKHTVTRRDVALKFLTVDPNVLPQMRRRFVREARAAAAVNHPNVIAIHDVFELQDETPVMVMDLLTGEGLGDKLARERALSVDDTAAIMAPVISAVGTAHALGIVHRDLKPENIFLAREPDGQIVVKVLDFGIAKLGNSLELGQTGAITGTGAVLGTPYYMALEQAYGEKDIDHRADIWSLGVMLYECLAGRRPIEGDNFGQIVKKLTQGTIEPLSRVAPQVPEDLVSLVDRMLQRAREDRPQDLREVLIVLRRYTGATTRTFGGAQAPLAPVEGAEGGPPESLRADPNPTLVVEDSSDDGSRGNVTTKPVADAPVSESRQRKPVQVRVITGGKAAPADVTLADSAAALPAPPPRPAHRTAFIAGGSAAVGIVVTAAVLFTMGPRAAPNPGPAKPAQITTGPQVLAGSPVSSAAGSPASSAAGSPVTTAVSTAEPAPPESAQPVSPVTSAHVSHGLKPVASASAKPVASAAPIARTEPTGAPTAPPTATTTKIKGLVDDPPF